VSDEVPAAVAGTRPAPGDDGAPWPAVAVVMPVRNEAAHLEAAVASALAQQYPGPMEVCLAVGPSHDGTEDVAARLAAADPRVRVVENARGLTPAGLNAGIRATTAPVIVRVDGHAELSPGYVRRAVETMRRTGAVNVGGVQRAEGETPFERAVALAMTSWFGTGGARFHVGGDEGPVDTVYLGVFDRVALEGVGLFDEDLVRNQDYELNIRLREAGGTVWFDPQLWVRYRPRGSLRAVARQYYEYGEWKSVVARRFPGSLRVRQLVPVGVTLAVGLGLGLGLVRRPAMLVPLAYATCVTLMAAVTGRASGRRAVARLLAIFPVMHLSWGGGFLVGLVRRPRADRAR
jgi:GT2 family glycosyltransferase